MQPIIIDVQGKYLEKNLKYALKVEDKKSKVKGDGWKVFLRKYLYSSKYEWTG